MTKSDVVQVTFVAGGRSRRRPAAPADPEPCCNRAECGGGRRWRHRLQRRGVDQMVRRTLWAKQPARLDLWQHRSQAKREPRTLGATAPRRRLYEAMAFIMPAASRPPDPPAIVYYTMAQYAKWRSIRRRRRELGLAGNVSYQRPGGGGRAERRDWRRWPGGALRCGQVAAAPIPPRPMRV